MSLDECHFAEKVLPRYGYSMVGKRRPCRQRNGSWKAKSLVFGIATDGSKYGEVLHGAVTRQAFGQFINNLPYPPGTVILLDNCSIHKKLESVFAGKGYIPLFLSPYSPQFQPVELAFSKVKGSFRNQFPWSSGVLSAIEQAVAAITPSDITSFFRHSGRELELYTSTVPF